MSKQPPTCDDSFVQTHDFIVVVNRVIVSWMILWSRKKQSNFWVTYLPPLSDLETITLDWNWVDTMAQNSWRIKGAPLLFFIKMHKLLKYNHQ